MKKLLLLITFLSFPLIFNAQIVINGQREFSSQEQIDFIAVESFPLTVTEITGLVIIRGNDITDLSPLLSLTSVGALAIERNPILTNLNGLQNITTVGGGPTGIGLSIYLNPNLTDISGLRGIQQAPDGVFINGNPQLTSLNGLQIVNTNVLEISDNNNLINLNGLDNVVTATSLNILQNPALTDISSLSGIQVIPNDVLITENASLTTLSGLQFTSADRVIINGNNSLTNLNGLQNLVSVTNILQILQNPQLTDLSGLNSVTSANEIAITLNNTLPEINGFTNLLSTNLIRIENNTLLNNFCGLQPWAIANPTSSAFSVPISNAYNPSLQQLITACDGAAATTDIDDPEFERYLADNGLDNDPAVGQVITSDIEGLTDLSLDGYNVSDFTGLQDFTSLESFSLSDDLAATIDVIDFSGNLNLRQISILNNGTLAEANLLGLNISNNTNLEGITITGVSNNFNSITIGNKPNLTGLLLIGSGISSIDLSGAPNITGLFLSENTQLKTLDVNNLIDLEALWISATGITNLDLQNNVSIERILASNSFNGALSSVNLRNGTNSIITSLVIDGNPNLTCVQVDDATVGTLPNGWVLDPQTQLLANCSAPSTFAIDSSFESYLIAEGIDSNPTPDNAISFDDAAKTTNIRFELNNLDIQSLSGIENFTFLEEIFINGGSLNLTTLNFSQNKLLKQISTNVPNLNSLIVNGADALENVRVGPTQLTSLDVSQNQELKNLSIYGSQITTIDVAANTKLEFFVLDNTTTLTSDIIFSNNNALNTVVVLNSNLTNLNLVDKPNLSYVDVTGSSITNMFLQELPVLTNSLFLNNSEIVNLTIDDTVLQGIDVSLVNNLEVLDIRNNRNINNLPLPPVNSPLRELTIFASIANDNNPATAFNYAILDRINLEKLEIWESGITNLTIENCANLDDLIIGEHISSLTELQNVTIKNTALVNFNLGNNNSELLNVEIENNPLLTEISTSGNGLSSLERLSVVENNLGLLDVSRLTNIETLSVRQNPNLTVLDLTAINNGAPNSLVTFEGENTGITDLDFSTSSNIERILLRYDSNLGGIPLTSLNIQNGNNTTISELNTQGNYPSLSCVQVDANIVGTSPLGWTKDSQTRLLADCNTPVTLIPDPEFERFLADNGLDNDPTVGQVITADIVGVTNLDIDGYDIVDFTGLEDFAALDDFLMFDNEAASINTIDFSGNPNLTQLTISNNNQIPRPELTGINISNNFSLEFLTIIASPSSFNTITIGDKPDLIDVLINGTGISSIDLSGAPNIDGLFLSQNSQLTTLNVSNLQKLEALTLSETGIADLDLQNNPNIESLGASNSINGALNSVNLRNGVNNLITSLNLDGNPNLNCVQVDDATVGTLPTGWNLDSQTQLLADCSTSTTSFTATIDIVADGNFSNSLEEGNSDIEIRVSIPNADTQNLIVDFDIQILPGSATANSDYNTIPTNETFTYEYFNDGLTFYNIGVLEDVVFESDENFVIRISNPSDNRVSLNGANSNGNLDIPITIVDDELVVAKLSATIGQEGAQNVRFIAQLEDDNGNLISSEYDSDVTFDLVLNAGTALPDTDYFNFQNGTTTITILSGDNNGVREITVVNDNVPEDTENFSATLSNPSEQRVSIAIPTSDATILDNDSSQQQPKEVEVFIEVDDAQQDGSGTYTYFHDEDSADPIEISFNVLGTTAAEFPQYGVIIEARENTAFENQDFEAKSQNTILTTVDGGNTSDSEIQTLQLFSDNVIEDEESFFIDITPVDNSIVLVDPTNGLGTTLSEGETLTFQVFIRDSENPEFRIVALDDTATEEGETTGTVQIGVFDPVTNQGLTNFSSNIIDIEFTTSGDAISGSDYTVLASPVQIGPGATAVSFSLTAIDDPDAESTESVVFTLSNSSIGNVASGGDGQTVISILDNDSGGGNDADNDGIIDNVDNCPTNANADQADLDNDGVGDVCDPDIDGDGIANADDAFPTDPTESSDTDSDGVGDNGDNCPNNANPNQTDTDGDGIGDVCETANNDADNDGVLDNVDNCPNSANANQADLDNDGVGDVCDPDIDGDGILNEQDDCPEEFGLPEDNGCPLGTNTINSEDIKILVLSETCPNQNNGSFQVSIDNEQYTFNVFLDGVLEGTASFGVDFVKENLAKNVYELCLTITELPDFQQCFGINIDTFERLAVDTQGLDAVNLKASFNVSGSKEYKVWVNNEVYQYEMSNTETQIIEVPIQKGTNSITITGKSDCQGIYKDIIQIGNVTIFPNPLVDILNFDGFTSEGDAQIMVHTISGQLIVQKSMQLNSGRTSIDLSQLQKGVYLIRVITLNENIEFKIIKK